MTRSGPSAARGRSPRRDDAQPRQLQQGMRSRVLKRVHHARHVVDRTPLDAPRRERQRGLSLEIDDQKILARVQHVPQVIIPVAANAWAVIFWPATVRNFSRTSLSRSSTSRASD